MAPAQDNSIIAVMHPVCCGLDVHKEVIAACLLYQDEAGEVTVEMREFDTFTADLMALRDWLMEHDCPIAAMESTGIYWQPVHNILEHHLQVVLVNARHIKNLPGRKTDLADSKWLAGLLRHGLLKGSFIPPAQVRQWRDLSRLRKRVQETLADYKRRAHKLLQSANIKLDTVASDLFGATGQQLLRLLATTDRPLTREDIDLCSRGQLRGRQEELYAAVQGFFLDHHRFVLQSLLRIMDPLTREIAEINQRLQEMQTSQQELIARLKKAPGISDLSAGMILAELGDTLADFPTSDALASWAGLCPGNHQSAGKRRSGRSPVRSHNLKTLMVQVAWAAVKKKGSYYKDKFHRLKARLDSKRAIVAIAHRLLRAVYHIIKEGVEFRDLGEQYLSQKNQAARLRYVKNQARLLGYDLAPLTA
jgi:transposase